MERQIIVTDKAPAAIGPYAQANRVGDFIFTSGQLPLDPVSGETVGVTVSTQLEQALKNLKALLEASGSSLEDVIKTTVFLTDKADFAQINGVYTQYFSGDRLPSRSAVAVNALPRGVLVEIEAIALVAR